MRECVLHACKSMREQAQASVGEVAHPHLYINYNPGFVQ